MVTIEVNTHQRDANGCNKKNLSANTLKMKILQNNLFFSSTFMKKCLFYSLKTFYTKMCWHSQECDFFLCKAFSNQSY